MAENWQKEIEKWFEIFPLDPATASPIHIIVADPLKPYLHVYAFLVDKSNTALVEVLKSIIPEKGVLGPYIVPSVERLANDFKKVQAGYKDKKPKVHSWTIPPGVIQPYLDSYVHFYRMQRFTGEINEELLGALRTALWDKFRAAHVDPKISWDSGEYRTTRDNFTKALNASLKDAREESRTKEQG